MVSVSKGQLMDIAVLAETAAIGYNVFIEESVGKLGHSLAEAKLIAAIANVVGPQGANEVSKALFPGRGITVNNGPHINVFGWFNRSFLSGLVLYGLDSMIADRIPQYSKFRKFVLGAATGLTIGGFAGGLFDPPSNGLSGSQISGLPSVNREVNTAMVRVDAVI